MEKQSSKMQRYQELLETLWNHKPENTEVAAKLKEKFFEFLGEDLVQNEDIKAIHKHFEVIVDRIRLKAAKKYNDVPDEGLKKKLINYSEKEEFYRINHDLKVTAKYAVLQLEAIVNELFFLKDPIPFLEVFNGKIQAVTNIKGVKKRVVGTLNAGGYISNLKTNIYLALAYFNIETKTDIENKIDPLIKLRNHASHSYSGSTETQHNLILNKVEKQPAGYFFHFELLLADFKNYLISNYQDFEKEKREDSLSRLKEKFRSK